MVLSVIIVHYRVPYFLDGCLRSLGKALEGLDAEILVVDNHSADGSLEILRPSFPNVHWILNPVNTGFAHANNLALQQATGEYILFLNPDTIVPEDFGRRCLAAIHSLPHPGALGVRMIDGGGHFLKESRRGFPTPWVAFCRLAGLAALFPRSRFFAGYYLGNIPAGQTHRAPVISGACFFVSRAALTETGAFDETFFMYAEDIDLSYRLEKAGYINYYYPDITIIHFKGESTQRNISYTRQFYKAMIQFRRKHFRAGLPGLVLLEPAIWLRAGLSAVARWGVGVRPSRPRRSWLTGDPAAMAQLKAAFAALPLAAAPLAEPPLTAAPSRRTLATDLAHADEIIYCIGNDFSFKSAIDALEKKDPAKTAAFYAAGSRAVIGSARSDRQGEIWIL
ncbi:MAG TPA: glycosyltransferase family 2 protein [Puia sp.]|nr:glycosyltransferase family 2 protein [Puia sp.]